MRLEPIDETRFNCFLSSDELEKMNIRLRDLTYGSQAARKLFRKILDQAHKEFDFELLEPALVVEAVPMEEDGLLLQFRQVSDPEELDNRFSNFAPHITPSSKPKNENGDDMFPSQRHSANDIIRELSPDPEDIEEIKNEGKNSPHRFEDLLNEMLKIPSLLKAEEEMKKTDASQTDANKEKEGLPKFSPEDMNRFFETLAQDFAADAAEDKTMEEEELPEDLSDEDIDDETDFEEDDKEDEEYEMEEESQKEDIPAAKQTPALKELHIFFQFEDFDTLCDAARCIANFPGESALYKRQEAPCYQLYLSSRQVSPEMFNSVCNILSEWGVMRMNQALLLRSHLEEHGTCLIKENAVSVLANL